MLQLYIIYKISLSFGKFSSHRIFSHFAICKRTCDKDIVFCQLCSGVYSNDVMDDFDMFNKVLVNDRFNKKNLFTKKFLYLDIVYSYYKYINMEQSAFFGCQHYQA